MHDDCPHTDAPPTARQQSVATRCELPPGPKGQRLRNFYKRTTRYPEFMEQLQEEYGDIVSYELPFMKCCAVFSADLIREILVAQQTSFPPWFPGALNQFLDAPGCRYGALPLAHGEEQRQRSELMEGAFSEERVETYAESVLAKARELCDRCRPGPDIDVVKEMERYTWDVLVAIIAGRDVVIPRRIGEDLLDFMKAHLVQDMLPLGQLLKKLPLPVFRRGYESNKAFDKAMYAAMERARDPSHPGDDVISHYIRARDWEDIDWVLDHDRAIRDEMFVLLNAFIDAPAAALVFGIHLIARHPRVRDRLEREVDEVIGDRPVGPGDFHGLPYMQAVLSEVLRFEPPTHVLLPKEARRDCVVGGYLIPKGTLAHVAMRVLHHRPEHWDDPEEFRPERWLEDPPPGPPRVPGHAYIPFGLGAHVCRGADVATRLFVLGMATFMQRLRFEPQSTRPPKRNDNAVGVKGSWFATVRDRSPGSAAGAEPAA